MSRRKARNRPSEIERHFRSGHVVAALRVADEMLVTIRHPAHRAPKSAGRLQDERVFPIHHLFGPKTSADILGHDPKIFRRNFENVLGDDPLEEVDPLASEIERQPAGLRVVLPHRRTRLQEVRDHPWIDDFDPDPVRRPRECGLGLLLVADKAVIGEIAGRAAKTSGAPGLIASSMSTAAGSSSQATPISSAPSRA